MVAEGHGLLMVLEIKCLAHKGEDSLGSGHLLSP